MIRRSDRRNTSTHHGCGARFDAELDVHMFDVLLHRARADVEYEADIAAGLAARQPGKDIADPGADAGLRDDLLAQLQAGALVDVLRRSGAGKEGAEGTCKHEAAGPANRIGHPGISCVVSAENNSAVGVNSS